MQVLEPTKKSDTLQHLFFEHFSFTDRLSRVSNTLYSGGENSSMTIAARRKPDTVQDRHAPMHSARVDRGHVGHLRESGVLPVAHSHDIGALPLPAFGRIKLVAPSRSAFELQRKVTLCIYGWQNVQPGTLSWVFPSLETALRAAHTMRNALEWVVLDGPVPHSEIDWARRRGTVLASS